MVLELSMPRKRYPYLPRKAKLYEGINQPASQKTLLTVRQINAFYDKGHGLGHTRKALARADLTPVAFGPVQPRNGQPPMLFRAGDAKRALQMANTDTNPFAGNAPRPASAALPPEDKVTFDVTVETVPGEPGLENFISEEAVSGFLDQQWERYQRLKALAEGTGEAPDVEPDEDVPASDYTTRIRESTHIQFNSIVDDESCDTLLQNITEAIDSGAKAITLWVSSEGGSLFSALGLYDHLRYIQRTEGVDIYTIAKGYVLSAGTILLAAGARRFSLPHAMFMLHEPYQMPWESGEDAKVLVTEIEERHELHELSLKKIAHVFYERDRRPEADYEAWLDIFRVPNKTYFEAEQALDWGLVDSIL